MRYLFIMNESFGPGQVRICTNVNDVYIVQVNDGSHRVINGSHSVLFSAMDYRSCVEFCDSISRLFNRVKEGRI